jgi:hypothetical protein
LFFKWLLSIAQGNVVVTPTRKARLVVADIVFDLELAGIGACHLAKSVK